MFELLFILPLIVVAVFVARPYTSGWRDDPNVKRPWVTLRVSSAASDGAPDTLAVARLLRVHKYDGDYWVYRAVYGGADELGIAIQVYGVTLRDALWLYQLLRAEFRATVHCAGIAYVDDAGVYFVGCSRRVASVDYLRAHNLPIEDTLDDRASIRRGSVSNIARDDGAEFDPDTPLQTEAAPWPKYRGLPLPGELGAPWPIDSRCK